MRLALILTPLLLLCACGDNSGSGNILPDKPDRWLDAVRLQADTKASYVGKTSGVLQSSTVKPIMNLQTVALGDTINGVAIAAIKCSFFNKDSSYSGEQFMWRGRWGCMAGRSRYELENAVKDDGSKVFDYIHLSPVTLPD